MTTTPKQRPIARLVYRAAIGKDENGRDIYAKQSTELASIWASRSGKADIVRFKGILPTNLDAGQFLLVRTNFDNAKAGGQ